MMPITEKSIGLDGRVFAERRGEIRRRVTRSARPCFNQGRCALRCVVRDLSAHGARLRFGDICALPLEFELEIAGEATARRARVCWRTLTEMGVLLD